MQHSLIHIFLLVGAGFLSSCGGGGGSGSDETSGGTEAATIGGTEAATTGACTPGSEGCTCYEGNLCLVGLKCLSELCVDPGAPEPTGGASSSGETTDAGGTTSGATTGDDDCQDNSECGPNEVCFDSFCTDADGLTYWVTITKFAPESCADGFGDAELYYRVFLDGAVTETSPSVGCPGDWSAEIFDYDPASSLEIEFWDVDAIEDDFITSLCWIDESEACGPVPASVLHDGGFSGLDSSLKYTLKVDFTVAIEAP